VQCSFTLTYEPTLRQKRREKSGKFIAFGAGITGVDFSVCCESEIPGAWRNSIVHREGDSTPGQIFHMTGQGEKVC